MKRLWWLVVVIVFLIIADQLSKGAVESYYQLGESTPVIENFFHITYVQNTGAFWGIGQSWSEALRKFVFLFLSSVIALGVIYLFLKTIKGSIIQSWGLTLIIAGAIGNLMDRFLLGYVIDMFDFFIIYHETTYRWAVFNIADACICIGMGLLIYDEFFIKKKELKEKR